MWVKGDVNREEESEGKRYGEERISEEEKKGDKILKSSFQRWVNDLLVGIRDFKIIEEAVEECEFKYRLWS